MTIGGWRSVWAAGYDAVLAPSERGWLGRARRRCVALATGTVVEIGAGTAANGPWYPAGAERIVATEPDPVMLGRVRPRRRSGEIVRVVASAEALPLPDACADTVVGTLVLCTIPDPERALAEVRRVLRPSGRYLFLEHGGAPTGTRRDRWQHRIEPLWRPLAGGCHLTRHASALVTAAGFTLESTETMEPPVPSFLRPFTMGVAIR